MFFFQIARHLTAQLRLVAASSLRKIIVETTKILNATHARSSLLEIHLTMHFLLLVHLFLHPLLACFFHFSFFSSVKKPREQAVDGELMCTLAEYGVEMSKKLGPKGAAAFSAREFIATLCRTYVTGWDPQSQAVDDPGSFDWSVFGSSVSKHFVEAPTMSFM